MSTLKYVNFSSPMETKESGEIAVIKGFASVSNVDREREIVVDPREFDVATFMASPTLLMDHKFVKDEYGNDSTAGVVKKAIPSYVKSITDSTIEVFSLESDEFVDSISKSIAHTLKEGDRGLFITAEVRHPIAVKKVLNGEMGGLSWRGIVKNKQKSVCPDGHACNLMRDIDLFEISIVHNQAQSQSTFMVEKSEKGEQVKVSVDPFKSSIYGMRFLKTLYPSVKTVHAYMDARKLVAKSLEETDEFYVAYTDSPDHFETSKSFAVPMGGVEFVMAPEIQDKDVVLPHVGDLNTKPVQESKPMADTQKKLRLFMLNEQGLLDRFPGVKTYVMKSVMTEDGEAIDVLTLDLPEEPAVEVVDEVETEVETPAEEVVAETSEPTEIEKLQATIAELKAAFEAKAEPEAKPEPTDVEKLTAQLEETQKAFADVKEQNDKLRDIFTKLAEKDQNSTPSRCDRSESVTQKSVGAEPTNDDIVKSFFGRSFAAGR